MTKNLYVILSCTPTKIGKTIRFVTKTNYNHMSISLDDDLSNIYTFGRKKHTSPCIGGLVKENIDRFTLLKYKDIPVKIYKIPISEKEYSIIFSKIKEISLDEKYIYNLLSMTLYIFTGGFHINKSFTCVEFTAYIVSLSSVKLNKTIYQYTPNELGDELNEYLYYKNNLLDYPNINKTIKDDIYFKHDPLLFKYKNNVKTISTLIYRTVKY